MLTYSTTSQRIKVTMEGNTIANMLFKIALALSDPLSS
jgi:hypothetical protein